MATSQRRASSWTNSDGLVVGFGPHKPTVEGSTAKNYGGKGGAKVAAVNFDWKDLNAGAAINLPVPAGTRVLDVRIVVVNGFTSTGTNTCTVGDGNDADGFITTSAATTTTMATAGAVIMMDGVYSYDDTADGDVTAAELKAYSTADTIDLASGQTDWTAGSATVVVTYL